MSSPGVFASMKAW